MRREQRRGEKLRVLFVCRKSYFEQKRYPRVECYVKAVGIDKEREQGHKGIVEVGFDDVAAKLSAMGAEGSS